MFKLTKHLIALLVFVGLLACVQTVSAQEQTKDTTEIVQNDSVTADSAMAVIDADLQGLEGEGGGLHKQLKRKFIEGSAGFMSLVALALVLGLAFCIERIIYLTLSEVKTKKLMRDIDEHLEKNDVDGAKELCRNTRGPVASICYQGLLHISEPLEQIDRQLTNYGAVQINNMEKGCTWIRLFIAVAPSLGFLGTVIGMVMAFDRIQTAGDISPTIVAAGMKVALITTIFGIIVAVILQFFYNYILSKIEHLTAQMEESAIIFMDSITQYKTRNNG
jgi:biopolymer transport protein ExbB